MTEEQIKQNAKEYYQKLDSITIEDPREPNVNSIIDAYIAGAHSRDEEIEELQNEIESLRKGFYERGDKLKELMLKNNELRNPWISVDKRLPDKRKKDENYSVNCIIRYTDNYLHPGDVFYTEAYYDYSYEKKSSYNKGGWVATYNNDEHFFFSDYEENGCVVTHWMPISELKKRE